MTQEEETPPFRCYVCARIFEGVRTSEDIMMAFEEGELFLDNRVVCDKKQTETGTRSFHTELELLCMECAEKREKEGEKNK